MLRTESPYAEPSFRPVPGLAGSPDAVDGPTVSAEYFAGNGEVAELLLLLPAGQAGSLEREARRRGLTAGQMLRCLVGSFLACIPSPPPATEPTASNPEAP